MFAYLLLLFISMPILELWLLIQIGGVMGAGPTIALVVLTGIIGAGLARREGLRTMLKIQERMAAGAIPTDDMVEGLLIFVSAVLLVTPGVITDAVGFAMLIGPIRRVVRAKLVKQFKTRTVVRPGQGASVQFHAAGFAATRPTRKPTREQIEDRQFIDVPFHDVTDESNAPRQQDGTQEDGTPSPRDND
ncbi:MAG: FxsA family protein [Planctomycetes bacterium]|nr:FxsA family protein [Planctomycetota bacterium]